VPVTTPSCLRKSLNGDNRYAYLEGTSMATPQVTALAALVANVNPFLSLHEKLRLIKATARRAGGWSNDLGWGIVDAGRAVDTARRIDHLPPASRARSAKRTSKPRVRIRWSGSDPRGAPKLIPSGVRSFDLYMRRGKHRYRRVRRATRKHSATLRLKPGVYRFYTRAVDKAGNREAAPRKADARLVVRKAKKRKRRGR
jgi:serine protease